MIEKLVGAFLVGISDASSLKVNDFYI